MEEKTEITRLLQAWQAGDGEALEALSPYIYEELRRLAASHMRREAAGHTLQATALVHEAWVRLVGVEADFASRSHFYALASRLMRRILVDHARSAKRVKRGGSARNLTLDESAMVSAESDPAILELDEALNKLAAFDARMAESIELMFFGGLSYEETASVLGVSRTTVYEDVKLARAWLRDAMN